jgi:hypothetical protein
VAYETRSQAVPSQRDWPRQQQPPDAERDPRVAAQVIRIRNAAIERMREMSSRHGIHAFDQRRSADALGPHAVAFLFHDHEQRQGMASAQEVVRVGTRLFRDSVDVRDLPTVLFGLAEVASEYADKGGFDPRTVMAHRTDPMTVHARYVGIGVSTLDTRAGHWSDISAHTESALQVPGRAYIALLDDSKMVLERGGPFGVIGTTWSTQPLEINQSMSSYGSWKPLRRDPNDPIEAIWAALDALQAQVLRGMQARGAGGGYRNRG